jgi:hypothetical protein
MEQTYPVMATESSAMPNWLAFSGIGAVVVIGFIISAVALGNKNDEVTSDDEE